MLPIGRFRVRPHSFPMNHITGFVALSAILMGAAAAQVTLSPQPLRVLGHPRVALSTTAPNLVEGRELNGPQGVAIDSSSQPAAIFVADTGNHRVLAWRNAAQFQNGAPADLVIGQRDMFSTGALGPGTAFSTGLNAPTGLVTRNGDLYVVDTGNNRVLRFPRPFGNDEPLPDLVIGQPNFSSRSPNQGAQQPNERTLALTSGSNVFRTGIDFDPDGNLWVADPGNRRVLRYAAVALEPGAGSNPPADLVLGQFEFTTTNPGIGSISRVSKDQFYTPSAIAFDSGGRLFVTDSNSEQSAETSRVLVFQPPFLTGMPAARLMGIFLLPQDQPSPPAEVLGRTVSRAPEGVVFLGDAPAIIDTAFNRILVFDPYDLWPSESERYSPEARSVFGQPDFASVTPNRGQPASSANGLAGPVAGAVLDGELFLADSGNHRVIVLPVENGALSAAVRVLGQQGFQYNAVNRVEGREFQFLRSGSGEAGMVVDTTSDPPRLYVADTLNNRVLGFRDARFVRPGDRADLVIGQPDLLQTQCNYPANSVDRPTASSLCRPIGLALDREGNLYVADAANGRVLRFPRPFAQLQPLPRANLVLGQRSYTLSLLDPTQATMGNPFSLAFTGDNGLLVSDALHNRVLFFEGSPRTFTDGMPAAKVFGQPNFTSSASGSQDNRLNDPRHIATDTDDRLYIADAGNNRVLIFNRATVAGPDPRPAVTLTLTNTSTPLRGPRGVYVNPVTGEIWVADTNGNRVLRYPRFDDLTFTGFVPNFAMTAAAPLALAQDAYGTLFVADATNRVALHYPAVAALNAANFVTGRALAPGAIASLYPSGIQFTDQTASFAGLPLPRELADVQVLVNDQPAPLFFVSPGQINFYVPMNTPDSGTAEVQVVRTSTGQTLAGGSVQMNTASPGLFTATANGSGQIAAVNQDGAINSPENRAARGSVISLYGTGQGFIPGAPPDGEAASGPVPTPEKPRVIVNAAFVADEDVQYSGLAPGFVGLWQINVRIPMTTPPSDDILVVVQHKSIPSNNDRNPQGSRTTIAVRE
jgi:uncharacterized protein (TIGR03437 family)